MNSFNESSLFSDGSEISYQKKNMFSLTVTVWGFCFRGGDTPPVSLNKLKLSHSVPIFFILWSKFPVLASVCSEACPSAAPCWPWGVCARWSWLSPLPPSAQQTPTCTDRGMTQTWRSVSFCCRTLRRVCGCKLICLCELMSVRASIYVSTLGVCVLFLISSCQISGCLRPRGRISWTRSRI